MKIKMPVRIDEWGDLVAGDGEVLAVGRGPNREKQMHEIKIALNERDDLIAQRDALVGACEALLDLAIFMSGSTDFSDGGRGREGWLKLKPAIDKGRAALALVCGEKNQ